MFYKEGLKETCNVSLVINYVPFKAPLKSSVFLYDIRYSCVTTQKSNLTHLKPMQ